MRYVTGCLFSAILGGLVAVWLTGPASNDRAFAQGQQRKPSLPSTRPKVITAKPGQATFDELGLSPEGAINVAVYEKNNKSVVNITTRSSTGYFLLEVPSEGSGSGSVIDKSGHILTNYHVIEGARQVGVTLFHGKTFDATLVGADPINDVAVLKIDAPKQVLHPVEFGDSGNLKVGMRIFAIGNPFGLERTMTAGIISSLNRSLQVRGDRSIRSIIQIDAAVNPGNSGGPLLDAHGRLIGINTAIASQTGQSAGIGFAIPINLVARVVPQLIKHGRVIRPEIGIRTVYQTDNGLRINQLTPNGPAARAGLRGPRFEIRRRGPFTIERIDLSAADLIIEVDGHRVETKDDFLSYIESKKAGDRIELTIIRQGRRLKVPIILRGEES